MSESIRKPNPGEVCAKRSDGVHKYFTEKGWEDVQEMQNAWIASGNAEDRKLFTKVPLSFWGGKKEPNSEVIEKVVDGEFEPLAFKDAEPNGDLESKSLDELKELAEQLGMNKNSYSRWTSKSSAISKIKQKLTDVGES